MQRQYIEFQKMLVKLGSQKNLAIMALRATRGYASQV
jgi:hypothetical protein